MNAKLPFAWCASEGCDRPRTTGPYCHGHYEYKRRTGQAPTGRFPATVEDRFLLRVEKLASGCWLWTGGTNGDGRYGLFQRQNAHRWSYKHFVGPIADGLVLDHLCRTTLCVNPEHLEPVTQTENIYRGESQPAQNRTKTHCKRGHEFTPENTYVMASGGRSCIACARAYGKAYQAARRAGRSFSTKEES